jgi:hypothetical protein
MLKQRLDGVQGELQTILDNDLKAFNAAVAESRIPPVAAAPKIGK